MKHESNMLIGERNPHENQSKIHSQWELGMIDIVCAWAEY